MRVEIPKKGKASVEIHDYDLWDMDRTIAIVIHPMLIKLKKDQHGFHKIDNKDVPKSLHTKSNDYPCFGYSKEKWDWALDEMIFAFGSKLRAWESDFKTGVFDMNFTKWKDEKGHHTGFKEGPEHTQVVDYDGIKVCEKRIRNGFKLFGKYYQALWN